MDLGENLLTRHQASLMTDDGSVSKSFWRVPDQSETLQNVSIPVCGGILDNVGRSQTCQDFSEVSSVDIGCG